MGNLSDEALQRDRDACGNVGRVSVHYGHVLQLLMNFYDDLGRGLEQAELVKPPSQQVAMR
jgi:hypothetical protein